MPLPNLHTVEGVLARFNEDLNAAQTAHERQAIRDRYLGRKNSVVAEWMERLAAAPPAEKKHLGQLTNTLKKELETRWTERIEAAAAVARAMPST
jgi:phenylalanyl-tRNA synthetase alpha subunit